MAYYNEIQRIVRQQIPEDIWQFNKKKGWVNECVFKNIKVDTHNLCIKLGQKMELIYPEIARIRYPGSLFPKSIAGHGVTKAEEKKYFSEKYNANQPLQRKNAVIILTRLDEAKTKASLTEEYVCLTQEPKKDRNRWSQGRIRSIALKILQNVPLAETIREVYVDLCPLINNVWTLMEVKLTGDCDRGKTRDMLLYNMLEPYVCLGKCKKELYFGIISDNLGSNRSNEWKGQLSGFITQDMILREEDLFDLLVPSEVSFEDFQEMICERISQTKKASTRPRKRTNAAKRTQNVY